MVPEAGVSEQPTWAGTSLGGVSGVPEVARIALFRRTIGVLRTEYSEALVDHASPCARRLGAPLNPLPV